MATLELARADLERAKRLLPNNAISKQTYDQAMEATKVGQAQVNQALDDIYQVRVSLGLPPQPPEGKVFTDVPADLDQTYSNVRSALANLRQSVAQLGLPLTSNDSTPKEVLENFRKRDPKGDIDRILADLVPKAPAVKQAEAKLLQAESDVAQAKLNLEYCDITSDITGVVTRRNINNGNYVQVGQSLMAVRSLTEVWIDANFKETQLAEMRIGQRVQIEVDMYGSHQEFQGRITGFTMGTGSTLALLPPENATGNFVKVVQRLPVRIDLNNYKPGKHPLFVGLSVTPYIYYKDELIGNDPGKGDFLQDYLTPQPAKTPAIPKKGQP